MRLSYFATYLAVAVSAVHAASLPNDAISRLEETAVSPRTESILAPANALEKRKGGGGRGGGGGSGGSSGGGGGGRSGSGGGGAPARTFGGGGYYGGGAAQPYRSGGKTPKGGLLAGGALGLGAAALIMPGLWLYSVYPYHFNNPYRFHNDSAQNATNPNGTNQSLPVTCLCQEYSECGCDENDDQANLKELVGNGSYAGLNKSLVTVADVNGTKTLVLNGTLENGTDTDSAARALTPAGLGGKFAGYWVAGLIVFYTCVLM